MSIHKDRRRFDRHSIDFRVEVISRDRQGRDHKEMTALDEVSGEGARFLTGNAERYFIGQPLEVSIWLPGSDEVKASMKGTAKVVRIGPCSNAALRGQSPQTCVAVKLDAPLYFERYSAR